MGCDIFFSITYDGDDDVGIFAVGVGAIPKSPYVGHKNSLVLIVKIPVSIKNTENTEITVNTVNTEDIQEDFANKLVLDNNLQRLQYLKHCPI